MDHARSRPRAGEIGKPEREVTFEPLPDEAPLTVPVPAAPVEPMVPVPA